MKSEMAELINSICRVILPKAKGKSKELNSITSRLEADRKRLEELELHERFFFNELRMDANFELRKEFETFRICLPDLALKYKRILVLINTLKEFLNKNEIDDGYGLNKNALVKIAKCYIDDLSVLKKRYNCSTVQLPKIAGLMTNLIVKYRPIVPLDIKNDPVTYINEMFAIYHALCICSDFSDGAELVAFEPSDECSEFYKDMRYLLNRNYTSESLIMVFKVLCLCRFPSFLSGNVDG